LQQRRPVVNVTPADAPARLRRREWLEALQAVVRTGDLIIASTGFSASSRVITTSDQLITELLNSSR